MLFNNFFVKKKFILEKESLNYIELKLRGIGLRVTVLNQFLFLRLGYSHYIIVSIPNNVFIRIRKSRLLMISNSKSSVTNFASKIKNLRQPDSYKYKGIIFSDEKIITKIGKQRLFFFW